jgi:integrase
VGTVRRLAAAGAASPTLGDAAAAYLGTLDHPESAGTKRVYAGTLRALRTAFGTKTPLTALATLNDLTTWFEESWGQKAAATYNRDLDALRSAIVYWAAQDWIQADPTRSLRRRGRAPDRSKALSRELIDDLLTRDDIALRERLLWRMLYETAARAAEILALDIDDLDRRNRSARVRRKGGAIDVVIWQTGTARLLPRMIGTRKSGPLLLTARAARVQLPAADLDPRTGQARLSYRRAAELFGHATTTLSGGPFTLHQLRHSALTHAAEDGANTATLLAYSGHTSVTSLARYTRLSPEALSRWQQSRDPARRR